MAAYHIAGPNYCPVTSDLNAHLAQIDAEDKWSAHVESCESDALAELMADDGTVWDWFRRGSYLEDSLLVDQPPHIRATVRMVTELIDGGLPAPHPEQSKRQEARFDRMESLADTLRDAYEQWLHDSGVLWQTAERIAQAQADDAADAAAEDRYYRERDAEGV